MFSYICTAWIQLWLGENYIEATKLWFEIHSIFIIWLLNFITEVYIYFCFSFSDWTSILCKGTWETTDKVWVAFINFYQEYNTIVESHNMHLFIVIFAAWVSRVHTILLWSTSIYFFATAGALLHVHQGKYFWLENQIVSIQVYWQLYASSLTLIAVLAK